MQTVAFLFVAALASAQAKTCTDGSPCLGGDCCCGTPAGHDQICFCKDHEEGFTCCGCSWCNETMAWCWNGTPGGNPVCGGCDQGQQCDFTGGDESTGNWPSLGCKGGQRGVLNLAMGDTKQQQFVVRSPEPRARTRAREVARTGSATTYYEKPTNETCRGPGEVVAKVANVDGEVCSPSCTTTDCPDAPAGVTALPECALQPAGKTEPTNCALACGGAAVCPAGSTCTTVVPGTMYAICLYPAEQRALIY